MRRKKEELYAKRTPAYSSSKRVVAKNTSSKPPVQFRAWFTVLAILLIVVGVLDAIVEPVTGIIAILAGIGLLMWKSFSKRKLRSINRPAITSVPEDTTIPSNPTPQSLTNEEGKQLEVVESFSSFRPAQDHKHAPVLRTHPEIVESASPACKITYTAFGDTSAKRLENIRSYVVLDTETTGLNRMHDRIIEISLARYENGKQVEQYSSLINPQMPIPANATRVNHITDEDVAEAPVFAKVWPDVRRMLDGQLIIGHNVTYDLGMIGYNMPCDSEDFDVVYLDTLTLARRVFKNQPSYALSALVQNLSIASIQTHRASDDVTLTAQLFERCRTEVIDSYRKELDARREERKRKKAERAAAYRWSLLLERNFVFTGEFFHDRKKLEQMLETVGANLRSEINSNTDYLVVGELKNLPIWAVERKYLKAKKLADSGKKVQIINEEDYIKLVYDALSLNPAAQK